VVGKTIFSETREKKRMEGKGGESRRRKKGKVHTEKGGKGRINIKCHHAATRRPEEKLFT